MGGAEWAQQSRRHDVAVLKYKKNKSSIHFGAAFNQQEVSKTGNILTTPNTYKTLQYAWFNQIWNSFSVSFLFVNNGLQFINPTNGDASETRFSQTLGSHLKYKHQKWNMASNIFYQFGNDIAKNSLSAYLVSFDLNYKLNNRLTLSLGSEVFSGNNDSLPSNGKNKAFSPLYGTNHKFNGLMDYFFVGNHGNNVGLIDINAGVVLGLGEKTSLNAKLHSFSSAAKIVDTDSKQLGLEADLVVNHNYKKDINIKTGFSQLFASEGMQFLKNNFDDRTNYWAWIMVTIKPTLFQTKND